MNTQTFNHRHILIGSLVATALSGCINNGNRNWNNVDFSSHSSSGTSITVSASPSPSPSPTATASTSLQAVISERVGAIGYTTTTLSVRARKVLKIKFTPGIQDETISGTNETPHYSGLGVYISVGGVQAPTPLLYNGYYGGVAQTSSAMDFSSGIPQTCSASDTACREDVTITISRPNYDWYCLNNVQGGCPWTHVKDTHPWHGTLKVQTDDTQAL